MAKKSLLQKIKEWFTGGSSSSKSAAKKVRSANSSYYSGGGSTSYSRSTKSGLSEEEKRKKRLEQQKQKQDSVTKSLASVSKRTDSLSAGNGFKGVKDELNQAGSGVKRAIKKMEQKSTPPDPKKEAAKKSLENIGKKTAERKQELKEWHEATDHRYDVNEEGISKEEKLRRRQNVKSRAFNNDTAVKEAEHTMKWHGKEMSLARGALSGATFGASDYLAKKATTGEAKKAEEVYQKNKSKGLETAGEVVGSLASFGATAAATDKLGMAAAKKLAPNAVEKLAGKKLIQNAAKRSVNKAVSKGLVGEASEELIKQAGKEKAAQVINAIGTDIAQNLTTGAVYDILNASTEYEWGSDEWKRELRNSALMNLGITSGIAGVSALRGGKRLAVEAAESLAKGGADNAAKNIDDAAKGIVEFPPRDNSAIEVINPNARRADDVVEFGRPEEGIDAINPNAKRDGKIVEIGRADDGIDVVNPDLKRKAAKRNPPRDEDISDIVSRYPAIEDAYLDYDGTIEAVNRYYDPEATAEAAVGRYYDLDIPSKVESAPPRLEDVETAPPKLEDVETAPPKLEDVETETPRGKAAKETGGGAEENEALKAYENSRKREYTIELTNQSGKKRKVKIEASSQAEALEIASKKKGVKTAKVFGDVVEDAPAKATLPESKSKVKEEAEQAWDEKRQNILNYINDKGSNGVKSTDNIAPPNPKGAAEQPKPPKNEDVNQFAGIDEDVSGKGFNAENEKISNAESKVEAEVNKTDTGKSDFDKKKDAAYAESGTGLNTDGKERMSAKEAQEFFDSEWRTTQEHTKRGYSTIAVTGDKGFMGVAHKVLKNGETVMDVYHDKENLAKGAQRVMSRADEEGGVQRMIERFNNYADNKLRLTENERRDQIYDCIAAVDFANANKDQPWAGDLFLAACKAGAEQTSGSGLSLHMWREMAMSSPAHRAKAVRQQILSMFNHSAGMRKALGRGKGDKIKLDELDDILKKNPALEKVLDELDKMGEATSVDEVNEVASKAILHARKAMPMTAFDQLTQWRYVAMLSSPKTHVRNIVSNIESATLGQLRDAIAGSVENSILKGNGVYGKKFKAAVAAGKIDESNYHKSAGGMSWKAFKDSHVASKTGFSLNRVTSKLEAAKLELETTAASNTAKVERLTKRIKELESAKEAAQKEFDAAAANIKRGSAKKAFESWYSTGKENLVANAEKFERRQYNGTVSKGVFKINDKMSKFIGNALETSDAISLERIYREKFDKILTANGWDELSKLAENGDEAAKKSMKSIEEYAAQEAAYTAALDTYRNYNALSSAMSKFINDSLFNYDAPIYKKIAGAGLHAIMPFTKVPVNLMKRGLDYSPVGLMTAKRNLTKAIESGNITEINRACERLAEGRIGTGIAMLGAGLGFADADGDLITGRLQDTDYIDKKKKDAGYQNYSMTLGDVNFTLDWATPISASLFTGVEFGRMLRNAFDQLASDKGLQFNFWKAFDVPMVLASTTLEPTLQLGVFQGINDTLESVVKSDNYDDSGTNINAALKIVGNIAGNYINSQISPALLGSLSRAFAPYDYFVTGETGAEYAFNRQLAKVPFLSERMLGAKTNVWGEIKNEKTDAGDYAKSLAKNLLSPANINKVTWDETDDWAADFYKETGYEDIFPKNNYKSEFEVGRIKGEHTMTMTNKEMAEYNVQRGRSGSDAIADALNTVVFNRYDKDSKGHRTIPHADNITPEERERLSKEFEGKGIKEVVDYIRKTPQFKNATVAEQKQVIAEIYGTNGGNGNEAKGAKRSAERYIAGKKGMSANEYDYYNETPRGVQENLQGAIDGGLITVDQALDFTRNAGKTYYTTDERGEKGGTVTTHYNKKEMMAYLAKKGYSYEEAEALYNAYKTSNAKAFSGIDLSSGSGYRRYGGGWRHYGHGGGGGKAKVPTPKKISESSLKKGEALVSKSGKSSTKATLPTLKRVEAKIDLPTKTTKR